MQFEGNDRDPITQQGTGLFHRHFFFLDLLAFARINKQISNPASLNKRTSLEPAVEELST